MSGCTLSETEAAPMDSFRRISLIGSRKRRTRVSFDRLEERVRRAHETRDIVETLFVRGHDIELKEILSHEALPIFGGHECT